MRGDPPERILTHPSSFPSAFLACLVRCVGYRQVWEVQDGLIPRKFYLDREEARRDVFNYIELFYNPKRRHGYANGLSPVEFEKQYFNRQQSVY